MAECFTKLLSLTKSQKSNDRFYAKFDNGEGFTVTIAHIADFGLYSGMELSLEQYKKLSFAAERSKVRSRAMKMLGARPMSKGEVVEKLVQKGEKEELAEETAEYLEEIGAIDEEDYSRMIVSHYAAKGYGAGRIKNELYRRKIPREMWDGALSHMPTQDDKIDRLLSAKLRGRTDDRREIKKATDMLLRRGFSYDEIRAALGRLGTEE